MIKIEIILQDDGKLVVNGPIQDKLVCWGMLVAAMDVIRTYNPADRPLIQVPSIQPPSNIRLIDDGR